MAGCNVWNVNYIIFQRFTKTLFESTQLKANSQIINQDTKQKRREERTGQNLMK